MNFKHSITVVFGNTEEGFFCNNYVITDNFLIIPEPHMIVEISTVEDNKQITETTFEKIATVRFSWSCQISITDIPQPPKDIPSQATIENIF